MTPTFSIRNCDVFVTFLLPNFEKSYLAKYVSKYAFKSNRITNFSWRKYLKTNLSLIYFLIYSTFIQFTKLMEKYILNFTVKVSRDIGRNKIKVNNFSWVKNAPRFLVNVLYLLNFVKKFNSQQDILFIWLWSIFFR